MTITIFNSRAQRISALCALCFILSALNQTWAIEKIKADSRAVQVINRFMRALSLTDTIKREAKVVKALHKSMLTRDGQVTASIKTYSFKKACDNVHLYRVPVKITEVHKGRVVTIGFKETAERGRIDKYFIAKRRGVAGVPAPLHIFWPEMGGKPKLINIGSL